MDTDTRPNAPAPDEFPQPPMLLIAGAVSNEEEAASVQQIATITSWMRLFSQAFQTSAKTGP